MRIAHDFFFEALRRRNQLDVEKALLDLFHRRLVFRQRIMIGHSLPQSQALALFIIVVKTGAEAATLTAQLDDHQFHEIFGTAWLVSIAQFLLGRLHHIIAKLQRGFVEQCKRTDRHAQRLGRIFDQGRLHTFSHQLHRLAHIRWENAVGEETTHVFDDDRGLFDLRIIIKCCGQSAVA